MSRHTFTFFLPSLLATAMLTATTTNVSAGEFYSISDGDLQRPTGYREWVYVGTPVTPNDMNDGKAAFPEHHNV